MSINIDFDALIQRTNIALLQNNLNISNKKIKIALTDFINQAIEHFGKNPPIPPIDEIERRAITHVITIVRLKDQQQHETNKITMQQMQPIIKIDLDKSEPLPLPEIDVKEDDEASFMRKLEEIEIARRIRPDQNQIPVSPIIEQQLPFQPQLPPQVIAAPTVIYIPTKSKISDLQQIIISSIDRGWDYNPKRSTFIWSGNISKDENMKLAFAGIFLPKIVATFTPIIIIEIQGAGGKKQNILCSLSFEGPIWDKWYVVRTTDSKDTTIRPISSPWTIKLLDTFNNPLNVGEDAQIIKSVDVLINRYARMELENSCNDTCIDIGLDANNLFFIKKNNIIIGKYKVLSKLNNIYQISCIESFNNSEIYNNLEGGIICNITHQIIMIVEIQKNEMQKNEKP